MLTAYMFQEQKNQTFWVIHGWNVLPFVPILDLLDYPHLNYQFWVPQRVPLIMWQK
jgi:hypothetical protein